MSKTYTKKEILDMCEKASKDMKSFYNAPFVNYKGKSKEKELYTEIVAEWLLDNIDRFESIARIEREQGYDVNHTGEIGDKTNRIEEYLAKQLYNSSNPKNPHIEYPGIGYFIDYQTPLKSKRDETNKGLGKIDLLSCNHKSKTVYILEFKRPDSSETMLRCVLEAYTYLKIISKSKLFEDFKRYKIDNTYELKSSPFVFVNGRQYDEYSDQSRKFLHALMKKLDSQPFFINPTDFQIIQM